MNAAVIELYPLSPSLLRRVRKRASALLPTSNNVIIYIKNIIYNIIIKNQEKTPSIGSTNGVGGGGESAIAAAAAVVNNCDGCP